MRLALACVLLTGTAAIPAYAADLAVQSKIAAVTVYPSGADVTRQAEVHLPAGDTALVFSNLPGDLDPATLRVEGVSEQAVTVGSVDSRAVPVFAGDAEAARKSLRDAITRLQDERGELDQAIADAEYQKSLMQKLAGNALQPAGKEGERAGAQDVSAMLDLVAGRLAKLSETVTHAHQSQRDIAKTIAELKRKIAALAPDERQKLQVIVHVAAKQDATARFQLKYRVGAAGWTPVYDARLVTPAQGREASLEIMRQAQVQQSTTEPWTDVALVLSTARPAGASTAPELTQENIGIIRPVVAYEKSRKSPDAGILHAPAAMDEAQVMPAPVFRQKVEAAPVQIDFNGFQAAYAIPARSSIDNSGTDKTVRIDSHVMPAEVSAVATPKLDPTAYLTADFRLGGDAPLLPGRAMLYRDGVFVGQGALPGLSAGEKYKLGFGADDDIRITRAEMRNTTGEEGILTSSRNETRAWDITVKNFHDRPVPVTILDQRPVSTDERIIVSELPGMTAPAITDFDRQRGVLAWTVTVKPGSDAVIHHGYKVTMPKDVRVSID